VIARLALAGLAVAPGLALGSYAVTVGVRLSRGESSSRGRSHCDACGAGLSYAQTIPVLSYLGLRGACSACGVAIDPLHLIGEVAGAVVLASAFWSVAPARALILGAMGLALITLAAVDAKTQRLPNPAVLLVAVAAALLAGLKGWGALEVGVVAAVAAGGVLLLLRGLMAATKGDPGLGLGDVKLIAALSLWAGAGTPWMILAASLLGLAAAPWLRDGAGRMPFGPLVAGGGWIVGVAMERGWQPWGS
jgi:leader peptidase (prepilin peptidase)/N-methyltransferase